MHRTAAQPDCGPSTSSDQDLDSSLRQKWRTAGRWAVGAVVVLAALAAIGWLAFVPQATEAGYAFVASWGGPGTAPGQFRDPTGLFVADGEVFVADARNGRVQVFDEDGGFRRSFGAPGDKLGELGRPMGLAIAGDEIYVTEYWNDRLQVFGRDGAPRRTIGGSGRGAAQFDGPGGVAVADSGDVFVADFGNHRVQHLRQDGSFVRQWGTGEIGFWGGRFNYPTDVALGRAGILYVADGFNDRIQVFAPDGRFHRKWGGPFGMNISGPFHGWFATVTSVAVDREGNLLAADFYNHRIQKFTPDGTFLASFGERGSGPGQFTYPIAVAAADDGTVFVTDYGNHRIQKWRPRP